MARRFMLHFEDGRGLQSRAVAPTYSTCHTDGRPALHRHGCRCPMARCQHGMMLSPLAVRGPAPAPLYARPHIRWDSVSTFNKVNATGLSANTRIAVLRASPLLTVKSRARPLAPQDPPKTDPSPP